MADCVEKLGFFWTVVGCSESRPSQSLCIPRLLSREYQTDPEKWAKKSAFEFFNRIDPLRTFTSLGSRQSQI